MPGATGPSAGDRRPPAATSSAAARSTRQATGSRMRRPGTSAATRTTRCSACRSPSGRRVTLDMTRVLAAAQSDVFAAFVTPDQLAHWWGPKGFTVPSLELDARLGARYRIEMQPPEGDAFYLAGEFREVIQPERLAYTFAWEDPAPDDAETLVELSFRELDSSTEVVLAQGP